MIIHEKLRIRPPDLKVGCNSHLNVDEEPNHHRKNDDDSNDDENDLLPA
jgi:hypothetical protein